VPAVTVILIGGGSATNGLIIVSQVILSLTLPFAVVPLVWFTASRARMGALVAPWTTSVIAGLIAAAIIGMNAKLVFDVLTG
jgi:manganese transport protein